MDWKIRIELVYRGYARQHRAIEDQFTAAVDDLATALEATGCEPWLADLVIGEVTTLYMPIAEENLQRADDKGLLVIRGTCNPDPPQLVVREWTVTIKLSAAGQSHADELLGRVKSFVEGTYTNIKIIQEAFTDVPPQ